MALQDSDLFLVNRGGDSFKTEYSTLKDNILQDVDPGGVSKIIAGENITIEPSDGTGEVTITGESGVKGTVGAIVAWGGSVAPDGWLECNGQAIPAEYTELIALIGDNVPDLRGEFIRGWDHGKGTDSGRSILSYQSDATAVNGLSASDSGHQHVYNSAINRTLADGGANGAYMSMTVNTNTGYANISVNSSDTETRPSNINSDVHHQCWW